MSVALELRALFSQEQLRELDAVSREMRANPQVLDNHSRQTPVHSEQENANAR